MRRPSGTGTGPPDPAIELPLPLFDFGGARRERARAAVIEARHRLTRAQRSVVEEVRLAYAAYGASRAQAVRVTDELIPLQQRRYQRTEAAFQAGETDATDLLLAGEGLEQAEARLIELQRAAASSLIRLQRTVGGAGVGGLLRAGPSPRRSPPKTRSPRSPSDVLSHPQRLFRPARVPPDIGRTLPPDPRLADPRPGSRGLWPRSPRERRRHASGRSRAGFRDRHGGTGGGPGAALRGRHPAVRRPDGARTGAAPRPDLQRPGSGVLQRGSAGGGWVAPVGPGGRGVGDTGAGGRGRGGSPGDPEPGTGRGGERLPGETRRGGGRSPGGAAAADPAGAGASARRGAAGCGLQGGPSTARSGPRRRGGRGDGRRSGVRRGEEPALGAGEERRGDRPARVDLHRRGSLRRACAHRRACRRALRHAGGAGRSDRIRLR